jgi:uncharacterized RDD family membrane protein YckC
MSQPVPSPLSHQVRLAGFFSRLIAFGLDLAIISVINLVILAGTRLIVEFFFVGRFGAFPAMQNFADTIVASSEWLTALISTSFGFIYFIFFWVISGFTPGKALLGLRVVRTDGRPVNLARAVLRLIAYLIAALPLFLGFIWILFDNRRQGWHDKIARTYVIYMWDKNSHPLVAGSPEHAPGVKKPSPIGQED